MKRSGIPVSFVLCCSLQLVKLLMLIKASKMTPNIKSTNVVNSHTETERTHAVCAPPISEADLSANYSVSSCWLRRNGEERAEGDVGRCRIGLDLGQTSLRFQKGQK